MSATARYLFGFDRLFVDWLNTLPGGRFTGDVGDVEADSLALSDGTAGPTTAATSPPATAWASASAAWSGWPSDTASRLSFHRTRDGPVPDRHAPLTPSRRRAAWSPLCPAPGLGTPTPTPPPTSPRGGAVRDK